MRTRQLLGILGSAILFIGVFMPIVRLPLVGEMNYFANGRGDGVLILLLSVISLALVLLKWYRELWITSLGSAAVLVYTFVTVKSKMNEMKAQMDTQLKNNPFRGLADLPMQSVQLQWGWAVLVIGIGLLIGAAAMRDSTKDYSL